ncbi:phosphatase PAP2 family protein [Brevibacillus laterosporus]|uniref:phosphatase PAP2 family protein n=1 Tax=Brevibacillus laterosporus TaxID=1465 RepID=UPI000CE50E96|nr:phosphatase PAP2 family protein [Brevibacillus laterosporus]MED1663891.1 phosphatase PAP2 family protein [Brevibacillus laterosporus]MED1669321.1 phosphatase PAP2 family protein [Brevibacillus laterosporus]MED1719519.1 phosphatase PAP2 family protein [Brevibacillus laterosporus]PPA88709.1 PAP2 family protein [Brevibacillus laterosporus]
MENDRMQDPSPFYSRFSLMLAAVLFVAFFWITYIVIGLGSNVMDEWGIMMSKEVRNPHLTIIMHAITQLGDVYILVIVVVLFVTGWWKKHRVESLFFLGTLALGFLGKEIFKRTIMRERPIDVNLIDLPSSWSFPSGHTTFSTLFFGMGAYLLCKHQRGSTNTWIWPMIGIAIPLLVGCSRIYLGVHFFSDVVAAWLYSAGCILVSTYLYERRQIRGVSNQ